MHPVAERYLRREALPFIFCPGCGHGTVLNVFLRAVDELGIIDELSLLGGIGCASWAPVYINTDVMHTLHGRAIPVATGLKLANPGRKVVVFTGDGDCVGIGGNHLLHGARRNIDITVIMMNNHIYGMTGGQVAPTTRTDARTQTSPYGNPEPPIDACAVAASCGATYVARWTSAHPRQLLKAIKEAVTHNGFSFIEVVDQCPTQAGRYMHGTADPAKLLRMIKKNSISMAKARDMTPEEARDKILLGTIHQDGKQPEFSEQVYALMSSGRGPTSMNQRF